MLFVLDHSTWKNHRIDQADNVLSFVLQYDEDNKCIIHNLAIFKLVILYIQISPTCTIL